MHAQKHAVWIIKGVQDGTLCFSVFMESIYAGDTDVALWELGNLSVFKQPKDPSASNFAYVLNPSMLWSPRATVCWPFLCVWAQVTLEAAMSNLSIHHSQRESFNGHAKGTQLYQII